MAIDISLPLIVSIDVGQQNLALCAIRLYGKETDLEQSRTLKNARKRLQMSYVEKWEVVAMNTDSNSQPFVNVCSAVAKFVSDRSALFKLASTVIIEQQMNSAMRCISAALFACISTYVNTNATLVSQHSSSKLRWDDLEDCIGGKYDKQKYSHRKKIAVKCAEFLLDVESPASLNCESSNGISQLANTMWEMRKTFEQAKKKDDLADSLLHLLINDEMKPKSKRRKLQ